jgi:hypothetical protein
MVSELSCSSSSGVYCQDHEFLYTMLVDRWKEQASLVLDKIDIQCFTSSISSSIDSFRYPLSET